MNAVKPGFAESIPGLRLRASLRLSNIAPGDAVAAAQPRLHS